MNSNREWLNTYQLRTTDAIKTEGLSKVLTPLFNAGKMDDMDQYRVFFQEVVEFGSSALSRLPPRKYQLLVYLAEMGHIHHGLATPH